jgi:DNA-binding FrmR family transcriptional regulator
MEFGMKHQKIFNRLRRIEGQVRGIEEMVASDRKEEDVLIQLEAARSSLASTISSLIEEMLEKPLNEEIKLDTKKINILLRAIRRS